MSMLPLGALGAPSKIQSSEITNTAQTHHKKGAQALEGDFATMASSALNTIGQAHVAISSAVQTALNTLKPGS